MLELLLAILVGVVFGTVTGLIPGIHINLVAIVLLTISAALLPLYGPWVLVAFILSMSITHTFTDFIASVYLGAPDDDTALSILPGHVLLLEGKAFEAIRLSVIGSVMGLLATIILVPGLVYIVPFLFDLARPYIGYILLGISIFMIYRESTWEKRSWSLLVFLSAGILGLIVLNMHTLEDPLFPLLSGLFGVSMLLTSLSQNTKIPPQKVTDSIYLSSQDITKATASGVFSGSLLSIFPGLGPAQAAILGSQFYRKISNYGYLILVGCINTVVMVMSLVTLFSIDKARNGSIIAVQELVPLFTGDLLFVSLVICLIAGGLATIVTLYVAKIFSKLMNHINYKMLSWIIIAFIASLAFYFNGMIGVFILAISTAIGIIPVIKEVGRNHGMGVLLLPVMLYFLV